MKFTNPFSILVIGLFATAVLIGSCKREYDEPPHIDIPVGNIFTIAELRALHQGEDVHFDDGHYSVYATVTGDESSGNIYRNIFVQDATGSIVLRLNTPGGVYQGDSVRIYLPGSILGIFPDNAANIDGGMMQLDSIDVDQNIIKQATNVNVEPQLVTIDEINPTLQARLVRIENVEFVTSSLGQTFADAENQQDESHDLTDCDGNTIEVRNSSYANFADEMIPEGNGSIIAVVDQFNTGMQLKIRNFEEVQMNGERCDGGGGGECEYDVDPVTSSFMDFSDVVSDNSNYSHPEWLNLAVQNNRVWRGRVFQSAKYLRATGYSGDGVSVPPTEIWLVSPPVQDATALSFESAMSYWTHTSEDPFKVFVSTDFDGCNVNLASWTEVTGFSEPTSSGSNFAWVQSGPINLTGYLPQNFEGTYHIGFRYYSVDTQTTSFDIDNINIQ